MPPNLFTHFVFVDFENVPKVDLGLMDGNPVHVTLLIGKKQTKLDTTLSLQLNKYAGQVNPVRVETSGPNALDIILACYLGQAVVGNPGAQFTIVSKDKDFEPLLAHLSSTGIQVTRRDSFAAAFHAAPKKPVSAAKPAPPIKVAVPKVKPIEDRRAKVVERLKDSTNRNRPGSRKTLLAYLKTALGKDTTDAQVQSMMDWLQSQKILAIADNGKVGYP